MIELYALPDDALADIRAAKLYEYTMVEDKVVIVDPTQDAGDRRHRPASPRSNKLSSLARRY